MHFFSFIPHITSLLFLFSSPLLCSPETTETHPPKNQTLLPNAAESDSSKEMLSQSSQTLSIQGKTIEYEAIAATMALPDENGKPKATLFYTAYIKKNAQKELRPITFCFNGGPGSSAIWLHMGLLGPKKASYNDSKIVQPPYGYVDNPYSLLDTTDLVFIDPVSTGFSKVAPGHDPKEFHGVREDIESIAEFLRLFVTRYERWGSPKFLLGESYGTLRAVGLAEHLHTTCHMHINGILLISCALDMQMLDFSLSNDLPCIGYLPSYAASAWYHQRLPAKMQAKSLEELLFHAEQFALTTYAQALLQGDKLDNTEKAYIASQLEEMTGINKDYWVQSNLRMRNTAFFTQLLQDKGKVIGRFDGRYTINNMDPQASWNGIDPSTNILFNAYASGFQQYLREHLGWKTEQPYKILSNVYPWNWTNKTPDQFLLSVSDSMAYLINTNPHLRIFVASGYYDLATPYFSTEYILDHLGLDANRRSCIEKKYYEAGHMMYVNDVCLAKLSDDLKHFFQNSLSQKPNNTSVCEVAPIPRESLPLNTCATHPL